MGDGMLIELRWQLVTCTRCSEKLSHEWCIMGWGMEGKGGKERNGMEWGGKEEEQLDP